MFQCQFQSDLLELRLPNMNSKAFSQRYIHSSSLFRLCRGRGLTSSNSEFKMLSSGPKSQI